MNLPVCVIITSSNCPHCNSLKSSGDFSREGKINKQYSMNEFKWDAESFCKLIIADEKMTPNSTSKFTVYEYDLYEMQNAVNTGVRSFTLFTYIKKSDKTGFVKRETFKRINQKSDEIYYILDDKSQVKIKGSFNELLSNTFPSKLYSYCVQFPMALYFSAKEWNDALKNQNIAPYGITPTLTIGLGPDKLIQSGPLIWTPTARNSEVKSYKKNYITYAHHLINNMEELDPPNELVTSKKVESKIKDESTKNPVSSKQMFKLKYIPNKVYMVRY